MNKVQYLSNFSEVKFFFKINLGEFYNYNQLFAGQLPALHPTRKGQGRHSRQVSGARGSHRAHLHGDVQRRRPAARHRVSLQQESPQRRRLSRAMFSPRGRQSQTTRNPVRHCRADEARQHILLAGGVFKFQGQEAPNALISMLTSGEEDIMWYIKFLYCQDCHGVAASREQCLAVAFANPKLIEILFETVEYMRLINTFCCLEAY